MPAFVLQAMSYSTAWQKVDQDLLLGLQVIAVFQHGLLTHKVFFS